MNNGTFSVNQTCNGTVCVTPNYGVYDPYWTIISDNQVLTGEPRPATAIQNFLPSWVTYSNSDWVSNYKFAAGGAGFQFNCCQVGFMNFGTPYTSVYEHKFQLTCTTPTITLSFSVAADQQATVSLNGTSLTSVSNSSVGTYFTTNVSSICITGTNTLRIDFADWNQGAHGINFNGSIVTGSNCILTPSCTNNAIIQGIKWNDLNSNGSFSGPGESGISGYPISLTDGANTFTTVTDAFGNYFFTNLASGNYTVIEAALPNYSFVAPSTGTLPVTLSANQVSTDVNFFNIQCFGVTNLSITPPINNGTVCAGATLALVTQTVNNCGGGGYLYTWNFGDGTMGTGTAQAHSYSNPGTYTLSATMVNTVNLATATYSTAINVVDCPNITCTSCIGSFVPSAGDYIISLWVREDHPGTVTPVPITYSNSGIEISFVPAAPVTSVYTVYATTVNPIIDGWQRIEARFSVPSVATGMNIYLKNISSSITTYFDDVRIHPVDATMKSYVYDPVNLRLVAELDENNYSTRYEYDEEGKLIRVKKETERGVMTIKETRSKTKKR